MSFTEQHDGHSIGPGALVVSQRDQVSSHECWSWIASSRCVKAGSYARAVRKAGGLEQLGRETNHSLHEPQVHLFLKEISFKGQGSALFESLYQSGSRGAVCGGT